MKFRVYIGTYTAGDSDGIYRCEFESHDGAISTLGLAAAARNPSFLAIHPTSPTLYAVNEIDDYANATSGSVSAFSIDSNDGALNLLNRQPSGGAAPCHITICRTGRYALVTNYGSGTVSVLPIRERGEIGPPQSTILHEGASVNAERQAGPHAHFVSLDPQNRFAFVADLGLDKVMIYKFDAENGALRPNDPPHVLLASGAGPRHFAFHTSGKWAYVVNELDSTITAFKFEPVRGALEELETISTLPEGIYVANTAAEVQVHPSGQFLYASNRGHDSIAMFSIHPDHGRLARLGHHSSGGRTPRHFAIDPAGKFLLAANQDSGNVVVHRFDADTGILATVEHKVVIPSPICVKFFRALSRSKN